MVTESDFSCLHMCPRFCMHDHRKAALLLFFPCPSQFALLIPLCFSFLFHITSNTRHIFTRTASFLFPHIILPAYPLPFSPTPLVSSLPLFRMQLVTTIPSTNALDLSKIRALVASFLQRKDCLPCMRVSRAWFQDFAPAAWHTIDFANDATVFAKVTPEILDKYGRFISEAFNTSSVDHLQLLQHSKVYNLKVIKCQLVHSCMHHLMLSDTFRRSQESLQSLDIQARAPNPDTPVEQRRHGQHFLYAMDAISSPVPSLPLGTGTGHGRGGGLRSLNLLYINITRETFSGFL